MTAELYIKEPEKTMAKAMDAEAEGNLEKAAKLYELAIKEDTSNEFPFDRLMIIYRKLKQFKNELRIISKGVRLFEERYKKQGRKTRAKQQKLTMLSNAFMKSAGLLDRKGNLLYLPEPLSRWTKEKLRLKK